MEAVGINTDYSFEDSNYSDKGEYHLQLLPASSTDWFDLAYLMVLSMVGTLGNLLIISSIIHGKCAGKNGNIFIISLACVDLIVSKSDAKFNHYSANERCCLSTNFVYRFVFGQKIC